MLVFCYVRWGLFVVVVVIFLPILFCVISSSAVAVAAASALLYLHLRLSLCCFVLWKVQVFPVAFGPCQRRLWNAEMLQCCQQKCQCMCACVCMLSACMYALFLYRLLSSALECVFLFAAATVPTINAVVRVAAKFLIQQIPFVWRKLFVLLR